MNGILKQYLEELAKYGDLQNMDNDIPFMEVVGKIVELQDPEAIPYLLDYLDDDMKCEYTSEEIQNAIESFEDRFYVPCLLKKLKDLLPKAKDLCEYFFWAIFNTPETLEVLKENIHLADKESILTLLDYIQSENKKPIIEKLRRIVNEGRPTQGELF